MDFRLWGWIANPAMLTAAAAIKGNLFAVIWYREGEVTAIVHQGT